MWPSRSLGLSDAKHNALGHKTGWDSAGTVGWGICFAPGDVFSASDRYTSCLRLSGGHSWQPRIENGLKALGEIACAALAQQ